MSGSVTGTDASIPLRAGQGVTQPTNPLQQLGQYATIQNQMNQNQLFPIIKQQQETQLAQSNLKFSMDALQGMKSQVTSLLADDGPITPKKVIDAATEWAEQINAANPGYHSPITADGVIKMVSRFPMPDGDASDPTYQRTARAALKKMMVSTLQPLERLNQTLGSNYLANNGQDVQPGILAGAAAPNAGAFTPSGAAIPIYPSRSELAAQVDSAATPEQAQKLGVPVGTKLTTTMVERLRQQGNAGLAGPAGQGGPGALGAPDIPVSLRNPNRQPPATSGPVAPPAAPPGQAQAPTPPGGAVVTGMNPAQTASQATTGAQSAQAFQALAEAGTKARGQDALLANMQADVNQFVPGPGADSVKKFKAAMVTWAPKIAESLGIDKDSVAAQESFDKIANQIADAQGAGSDARLAVNQAANPSSHLTGPGIDLILRQLRGNADYLKARAQLAANWGDKSDREGFENKVGANLDPRAFQYQRMTPEQKTAYFKGLQDKAAFKRSYVWAENNGLLGSTNVSQ